MAYTRRSSGTQLVVSIRKNSEGKFHWKLIENFEDATVDTKTGAQRGSLILDKSGTDGVADYDTAAAEAKAAFTAAG